MANLVFDFLHSYETGERRESEPANAYQYDEGHVLEAVLPEAVTSCEIHYWIRGQEKSEAYTPGSITQNEDGSCTVTGNIPNLYFETNGELRVYIVVTDGSASITTYEGYVHICQRSMPDDYVDDDPENEATRVLTEAQEAAATATAAAQTAQDVADSIPEDYSQLSEDVDTLKDGFDDLDDRVTALEQGGSGSGLTDDIKQALLQIAEKVAYIDAHGQDYYDDLYDALYTITAITLNTNSLSFSTLNSTQQLTATTTPEGGNVTWTSSDTSIVTVSDSGLVTSVAYGSATITATAGSISATCNVVVAQATLTSISAVYTQSGTVYEGASLDGLKSDLVVTASWSDSTTSTVASTDYTLSGTLEVGTSVITVSYGGKTDTFSVTVSQDTTHTEILLATLVPGTDFTYVPGYITSSTGVVTESESDAHRVSELIAVPSGTTSFSFKISKYDSNTVIAWYDDNQTFVGNGYGGSSYSQNGTYGDGYTDGNQDMWHVVPSNAKYCRIQWRPSDNTFSKLMFKHNSKLDETVTPEVNKVYYYTFSTSAQTANTDDYLPCSGMAYAHSRAVHRRGYTLYDSEKIAVSTQAVANNIGNNMAIGETVAYIRTGNVTNQSTNTASVPSRYGIGLIMFSNESLSSW